MMQVVLKFLKPYIERSSTLEEFLTDVGTMGGSIDIGWIEIHGGMVLIKDKKNIVIYQATLKQVWRENNQQVLI